MIERDNDEAKNDAEEGIGEQPGNIRPAIHQLATKYRTRCLKVEAQHCSPPE
jgi:hypothetical protein